LLVERRWTAAHADGLGEETVEGALPHVVFSLARICDRTAIGASSGPRQYGSM
jgi:hypothetical protein